VKFPRSTCPWKSGCFLAFERGDFSRNSDVLRLTKMGLFWEFLWAVQCAYCWIVGPVKITTDTEGDDPVKFQVSAQIGNIPLTIAYFYRILPKTPTNT